MFTAKLITSPEYYPLRRQQLLIVLLIGIPISLIANLFDFPSWEGALSITAYAGVFWLAWRMQQKVQAMSGQRRIEIDEKAIRISSSKKALLETIDLEKVDRIEVKDSYPMPEDSLKDIAEVIKGNPQRLYFRITQDGETRQFDFELETYYMQEQLRKVLVKWEKTGYPVVQKQPKPSN